MSISVHSCVSLCATEISGLLCLSRLSVKIVITQANIQLSPEGEVNSGVIYRDAEHRGIYLALFTDPEGDSSFSNQISWIKIKRVTFCKLKCLLVGTLFTIYKHFGDFVKCIFTIFGCKFSMKVIFYLPVNTDKPKFVAFLVFVCTTASFIAQISSFENVSKRDAILAPVAKQWIAKHTVDSLLTDTSIRRTPP